MLIWVGTGLSVFLAFTGVLGFVATFLPPDGDSLIVQLAPIHFALAYIVYWLSGKDR